VVDADFNELSQRRSEYLDAYDFLHASPDYGSTGDSPVYGVDRVTQERAFELEPERMLISDWLRPVYEGVQRIRAVSPIQVKGAREILAAGDQSRTGTLQYDLWVDDVAYCPFASVRQLGEGY